MADTSQCRYWLCSAADPSSCPPLVHRTTIRKFKNISPSSDSKDLPTSTQNYEVRRLSPEFSTTGRTSRLQTLPDESRQSLSDIGYAVLQGIRHRISRAVSPEQDDWARWSNESAEAPYDRGFSWYRPLTSILRVHTRESDISDASDASDTSDISDTSTRRSSYGFRRYGSNTSPSSSGDLKPFKPSRWTRNRSFYEPQQHRRTWHKMFDDHAHPYPQSPFVSRVPTLRRKRAARRGSDDSTPSGGTSPSSASFGQFAQLDGKNVFSFGTAANSRRDDFPESPASQTADASVHRPGTRPPSLRSPQNLLSPHSPWPPRQRIGKRLIKHTLPPLPETQSPLPPFTTPQAPSPQQQPAELEQDTADTQPLAQKRHPDEALQGATQNESTQTIDRCQERPMDSDRQTPPQMQQPTKERLASPTDSGVLPRCQRGEQQVDEMGRPVKCTKAPCCYRGPALAAMADESEQLFDCATGKLVQMDPSAQSVHCNQAVRPEQSKQAEEGSQIDKANEIDVSKEIKGPGKTHLRVQSEQTVSPEKTVLCKQTVHPGEVVRSEKPVQSEKPMQPQEKIKTVQSLPGEKDKVGLPDQPRQQYQETMQQPEEAMTPRTPECHQPRSPIEQKDTKPSAGSRRGHSPTAYRQLKERIASEAAREMEKLDAMEIRLVARGFLLQAPGRTTIPLQGKQPSTMTGNPARPVRKSVAYNTT